MNSPEYIFLDLGNVIVHFDHKKAVEQISSLSGIPAETVRSTLWSTDLHLNVVRLIGRPRATYFERPLVQLPITINWREQPAQSLKSIIQ